jgi:hypothetical protein
MSLADAVRKATAGIVPKLIGPEGFATSIVDTTRQVKTRDAANRVVTTPYNPLLAATWYIRELSTGTAQRIWGLQSAATAEAQVAVGTDVQPDDVIRVIGGDFAGTQYEVGEIKRQPLANRWLLELVPTGQRASVAPGP